MSEFANATIYYSDPVYNEGATHVVVWVCYGDPKIERLCEYHYMSVPLGDEPIELRIQNGLDIFLSKDFRQAERILVPDIETIRRWVNIQQRLSAVMDHP